MTHAPLSFEVVARLDGDDVSRLEGIRERDALRTWMKGTRGPRGTRVKVSFKELTQEGEEAKERGIDGRGGYLHGH
jgi:hypothetical protein